MVAEAVERQHAHTRTIVFDGYLRSDGLWDIDGELTDTKPYVYHDRERGALSPGSPIHRMAVRVTCDDKLIVQDIASNMIDTPFSICTHGADRLSSLIGAQMGPGWRQVIRERMGGTEGCSHLRELLINAATVAFQTISSYRESQGKQLPQGADGETPFFLNGCYGWAFESPVVARFFPKYHVRK